MEIYYFSRPYSQQTVKTAMYACQIGGLPYTINEIVSRQQ